MLPLFLLALLLPGAGYGQEEPGKQISMSQAVGHALEQSQLTLPGGRPFHLKAHIAATDAKKTEYTADVEEYWAGPQKWRRIVTAKEFSQTLIVNGESVSEKLTGDYYPFWLHDLVTAIFDPLPMAEQLKRMNTLVEIPEDSIKSQSCVSMQSKTGVAPAQDTLAYAFCFGGKLGLLQAAVTPGYKAQFSDYLPFRNKMVARTITADFAPGVTVAAKITELTEVRQADGTLFAVEVPTPLAQQIRSSQVGEASARILALNTPAMVWPTVREGNTSGVLSVYISTDRSGQVREAWPLGSSNPALSDAAREQVLRWQYKPFMNGGPSQMEAVLTFAFSTKIENPVPVLTNAEARKLATRIVPPVVAPGTAAKGTRFSLRISVDETGVVKDVQNPNKVAPALWLAGSAALKKWRFRPYLNNGKPDRFYADITLQAP
ncbi:MAG TPA: energy transducer TonB [Candidatus Angelobacter sp.]|nr:energy transducer TonB [Candidatus Angelobacter sp.]